MIADARRTLTRRALLAGSAGLPVAAIVGRSPTLAQDATPAAGAGPAPVAALVAGNTAFALALLGQLREKATGNLLFSPYSVSLALAMTYAGAEGETAAQIAEALDFTMPAPALGDAFAALDADLVARGAGEDGDGALRIANALWGERSYPFSEAHRAEVAGDYGAGLELVDFTSAPEAARAEINGWVAEQTEDRIVDIVPPGVISPATRLVLANAIYFYGPWRNTFEPAGTGDDTFHRLDGEVTVPFMVQQETFPYAQGDGFQAIELPYEQEGFAMIILLPDTGTYEAFEAGLDAAALDTAIAGLGWTEMVLHLPKFEFDSGESLADALMALGMTDAFDPGTADFGRMVEGTPAEPLAIGDVLHKAFISVDEDGTEAAAATVVMGVGAAAPPAEPVEVRVDRPFLFAIRDTVTGTLLFLGRVLDPSA
jgi:serpin B